MKKIAKFLIVLGMIGQLSSCDYLDIVPDERAQESDTWKTEGAVRGYLYSCYGYYQLTELSVTVIGLRKNSQLLPKNCLPLSNTVIIVLSVWDLLVIHGLLFGMVFINATCSKKA